MYDILILSGGLAGLSAAVAARQKNRTALVIGNASASNPLWRAERIDNYPGLPGVTGAQLLEQFEEAERLCRESERPLLELVRYRPQKIGMIITGSEIYTGRTY